MNQNKILKKLEEADDKRNKTAVQSERRFTKLFERFDSLNDKVEDIHVEVQKTNSRVTSLEFWQTSLKTKIATLSAIVSVIASGIVVFFKKIIGD